jgi:hypothetical protein
MALTARLLLRGTGLAGMVIVVGGLLAMFAATRPWFVAVAEVAMHGVVQDRAIAVQRGLPGVAGAWVTLGAGAMAVLLGGAIALDRPPTSARAVLVVAVGALGIAAAWAWAAPPAVAELAGNEGAQLSRLADRLPAGVALDLHARASLGPWLSTVAAAMVAGGTLAARDV